MYTVRFTAGKRKAEAVPEAGQFIEMYDDSGVGAFWNKERLQSTYPAGDFRESTRAVHGWNRCTIFARVRHLAGWVQFPGMGGGIRTKIIGSRTIHTTWLWKYSVI